MISRIKTFFQAEFFDILDGEDASGSLQLTEEKRRLACAALLIEVAIVDHEFDQNEFDALRSILQSQFGLTSEECETLVSLAQQECEDATSTYQFTQLVNQHCTQEEKYRLIKGMWDVAYADGDLDKYEEYIIRKVADLIHVAHGDFIRAKHESRSALADE